MVCTDKTGILTQNDMLVVAGSVGIHGEFVQKLKDHQAWTNASEEVAEDSLEPAGSRKHPHNFSIDRADFIQILSLQLCQLFNAAIAVNLTAFEDADPETSKVVFVGNKSDCSAQVCEGFRMGQL